MKLKLWQVDAFSDQACSAAIPRPWCRWRRGWTPPCMQNIAAENNLAETAFFVKTAPGAYDLRWFTPNSEVDLCGHATLASAYVIFRFLDPGSSEAALSDPLRRIESRDAATATANVMSLPSASSEPFTPPAGFAEASGQGAGRTRRRANFISPPRAAPARAR